MSTIVYVSKTKQFSARELMMLQDNGAEALIAALRNSSPVVALRALAEIQLNGDEEKLELLLADEELTAFWRAYESDFGVDVHDHEYAEQLEGKITSIIITSFMKN